MGNEPPGRLPTRRETPPAGMQEGTRQAYGIGALAQVVLWMVAIVGLAAFALAVRSGRNAAVPEYVLGGAAAVLLLTLPFEVIGLWLTITTLRVARTRELTQGNWLALRAQKTWLLRGIEGLTAVLAGIGLGLWAVWVTVPGVGSDSGSDAQSRQQAGGEAAAALLEVAILSVALAVMVRALLARSRVARGGGPQPAGGGEAGVATIPQAQGTALDTEQLQCWAAPILRTSGPGSRLRVSARSGPDQVMHDAEAQNAILVTDVAVYLLCVTTAALASQRAGPQYVATKMAQFRSGVEVRAELMHQLDTVPLGELLRADPQSIRIPRIALSGVTLGKSQMCLSTTRGALAFVFNSVDAAAAFAAQARQAGIVA